MFAKILMCECHMKKFHQEREEYVKKLIHFHCNCKEKHFLLVCFCDKHPYSSELQDHMEKECKCASVSSKDIVIFEGESYICWILKPTNSAWDASRKV